MSSGTLRARLAAGETLFTAWSTLPDPLVGEFLARSRFDAVTLDLQHGNHTPDSMVRGIGGIALGGKPAVIRIPVGRFEMASHALDLGADAVIAPMVNSVADAKSFASFMKFPPVGDRSWGPTRVLALEGGTPPQTYLENANGNTLAIAMIETRAAQAALDQILSVDGIDAVFVGPSDFSIALSNGARIDASNPAMLEAAGAIASKAKAAGKVPCTLVHGVEAGKRAVELGFRFIAMSNDVNYLLNGANALVDGMRKN